MRNLGLRLDTATKVNDKNAYETTWDACEMHLTSEFGAR